MLFEFIELSLYTWKEIPLKDGSSMKEKEVFEKIAPIFNGVWWKNWFLPNNG
jgi:hypothetical protein